MKMSTDERGVTLVETLLAAGIATMIIGVLGSSIFLFWQTTEQGNEQYRALHDVQNAGFWITRDGQRAQSTSLIEGADPVGTMTLSWTDGGQSHTVTYSLSGTNLQRNHDGTITTVARYISSVGFSFSAQRVITCAITSSPQGRWEVSEQTTYKVYLRPTA
jgi:VCBS repeat-containing protein